MMGPAWDQQIQYLLAPYCRKAKISSNTIKYQSSMYIPGLGISIISNHPKKASHLASVLCLGLITQTTFLNQDEFFKYTNLGASCWGCLFNHPWVGGVVGNITDALANRNTDSQSGLTQRSTFKSIEHGRHGPGRRPGNGVTCRKSVGWIRINQSWIFVHEQGCRDGIEALG